MKVLSIRTITGPNVYHHRPVLIMNIDLEAMTEKSSIEVAHFNDQLLSILPGLMKHHCSPGHEGGFVERLRRETYFAHIIEHIALELSELAGIGVNYGKSLYNNAPGHYKVIVRYRSEEAMKLLLHSAVELAESVVNQKTFDLDSAILHAKELARSEELGPSAKAILDAAKARNIPWKVLNDSSLIQLGYGIHRQFFQSTTTGLTSDISVDIAQDKTLTKQILFEAAIRVPAGRSVHSLTEALEAMKEMPLPVVCKPLDGNHGRGVTIDIFNAEEMRTAFLNARRHSDIVIVEECIKGRDYRIVVIGGKMVAASLRTPAHVTGDGALTVLQLVEKENLNPLRGDGHEKPLTKITINNESISVLAKKGITVEYTPAEGEIVYLKETANLSTGGSAVDVTDDVHPEIKIMCERAARIVGLDVCGIDLVAEDIRLPIQTQSAGIIELNAGPGIRMHHYPAAGAVRDVGGAIVNHLFPNHLNGRIPIVAITGTNGKTTVARLLGHIVAQTKKVVGVTTTDGIFIDGKIVADGDTTGPASAWTVLSDPSVEVAVLETARGGIVKRGLGYDWSDVGIFTNVKPDHIGQDGIESLDDILKIKSLVIERVRTGGTVILNADSPEIVSLRDNSRADLQNKKVIYFSTTPFNKIIQEHRDNGGHAYFLRGDEIIEAQGKHESAIMHVDQIPLSLGGTALFHVANAMTAIAGAHAIGMSDEQIREGIQSFNQEHNSGRTNLYKVGRGYLLLDYGHNADAFLSIGEMGKKWNVSSVTGVIATPGDRNNEIIKLGGLAASHSFDKIIIREDEDLRGRTVGEVASLLKESVLEEMPNLDCKVVLDSADSLRVAVKEMQENELVVYFYEDIKTIEGVLRELNASALKEADPKFFRKDSHYQNPKGREEWLQFSS